MFRDHTQQFVSQSQVGQFTVQWDDTTRSHWPAKQKSLCTICPFGKAEMSSTGSPGPCTHQELPINQTPNKTMQSSHLERGSRRRESRGKRKDWCNAKTFEVTDDKGPKPLKNQKSLDTGHYHTLEHKNTAKLAVSIKLLLLFQKEMREVPPPTPEVTSTALPRRHTPRVL